ncbi:MAG: nitroreductase family protein, partial [Cyclobacteriaceae bacterium]|nr:nitroreductase family protein [Cyclobacteriaceae bacterium]
MDDHKLINGFRHVRYEQPSYPQDEMAVRVHEFYQWADSRRTVRDISERPVADTIIENLIRTASTAPSGAHKQPWTFCAVSNADIKRQIRLAAEKEEEESYTSRMSDRWIKDLKPLATDWHKPFLEKAPWLIVVFKKVYDLDDAGNKQNHYYVNESVGIACGLLITAIHHAGLVTLTHTPSPMNFLSDILRRPSNERPFLLLPVGYP